MKKHIIWSNYDLKIENWQDYIEEREEENGETYTEDEKYEMITELNNEYLDDERENLDIPIPGEIIAIASMGLWNGRKTGYKIFNSLPDIFSSSCDECEWYVEGNKVLFTGVHHDGRNYAEYRILKRENCDSFLDKIYNNEEITKGMIQYYTLPLAPYIKKVYWWK